MFEDFLAIVEPNAARVTHKHLSAFPLLVINQRFLTNESVAALAKVVFPVPGSLCMLRMLTEVPHQLRVRVELYLANAALDNLVTFILNVMVESTIVLEQAATIADFAWHGAELVTFPFQAIVEIRLTKNEHTLIIFMY